MRDLRGTLEREQAAIGVLIALDPATKPMQTEATAADFYTSPGWGKTYPKFIDNLCHAERAEENAGP